MSLLAWNCRGSGGSLNNPIMNHLALPAVGLSGGLWFLWKDDITVNVINGTHNYILAEAVHVPSATAFGLLCIYDLNNIMNVREKLGPNPANCARISNFCAWVKECGLFDLGFHGPAYTWTNKRFSTHPTFQRLDRCLANSDWIVSFPNTAVYHLPMLYSDHCPILLNIDSKRQLIKKPFRFENWWLEEEDFQ
ncbi:hypothetical protein U9M48_030846 [Paspalum notatum var. saurae]|uniref:Endonuclease/exonuclease/phosphatase domain-containing protein n=1 Tax=Paspalum notatum var. saurae TaxID=547442 RepID=A0AAQ3X3Q8_PASNO